MKICHHRPPSTARLLPAWVMGWLVAALLVALTTASWLGAVHGTIHPGGRTVAVATTAADALQAPLAGTVAQPLRRLFGDHGHSGDCRLYDQLSHADGLYASVALPVVVLPPVAVLAWHAGECLRRWATLFDARGPPFPA